MTLPVLPIWIVDLYGSVFMIIFSFLCIRQAKKLRANDPNNVVWIYLLWFSYGLAGFAISRSVGHIVKRVLITTGHNDIWLLLRPYSGSVNTIMFVIVSSITLFFERVWNIYQRIIADQKALQEAHNQLLYLNRHLEELVAERTRDLAISEKKYRRLFEMSRDMIAIVDADGIVLNMNPAGLELLGWKPEDVGEKSFRNCFYKPEQWQQVWGDLLKYGEVRDIECIFINTDSTQRNVLLSGYVEAQPGKTFYHFWVKDISRRKDMERKLIQADKLASLGQLAAGVAHEINNPLGIILGYTQLLLRQIPEISEAHEDLKVIEKHARNCKVIVEDLLKFARSAPTRKGRADIHSAIEEVTSVLRHQFALDNVVIEEEFDRTIPKMDWDMNKMKQVFMNLLINAKQSIQGNSGIIRVETKRHSNHIVIKVSDNGCGIPSEFLPKIFDPFFTTKPTGQGTGLGLSVSYGIVAEHGGTISVESEEGRGSVFIMTFPIKDGSGEK